MRMLTRHVVIYTACRHAGFCTSVEHQRVIIAGAGPSGLALALWLDRYGAHEPVQIVAM